MDINKFKTWATKLKAMFQAETCDFLLIILRLHKFVPGRIEYTLARVVNNKFLLPTLREAKTY